MIEEQQEDFFHEHELPRKLRRGYDDITTPSNEGGDENER